MPKAWAQSAKRSLKMGMKISEFDGHPAIYVRWHTRKPKPGDHMSEYDNPEGLPGMQPISRLILKECLYSAPHPDDSNHTEDWWSFNRVSEYEFHRMRHDAKKAENISKTHDSLF